MTSKKTTRRALFLSVISLVLCMAMLAGTTFAWFTDEVESGMNKITAGNLDVELYHSNRDVTDEQVTSQIALFDDVSKWEPGAVAYENFVVKNKGDLALKYQMALNFTNATDNGNGGTLADVLQVYVVENGVEATTREAVIEEAKDGTKSSLSTFYLDGELEEGEETKTYGVVIYWEPTDNDNAYNMNNGKGPALTIDLGIYLFATQLEAEEDSFGPDYDDGIWDDAMVAMNESDLLDAIAAGETEIILGDDIELEDVLVIAEGAKIAIDLNGKTISGKTHKDVGPVIKNNGELTLKDGTISSTADNGGSALVNNGSATVENVTLNGAPNADGEEYPWPSYAVNNTGTLTLTKCKITSYHGAVSSYGTNAVATLNDSEIDMQGIPGFTSHGIYVYNGGKVTVNGGTYANKAADQAASGGSVINGAVTVNSGTFSGRIENYYGTPVLKGGTYSVKPNAAFVAADCKLVDNGDGTWTVKPPVTDAAGLKEALTAGGEITLGEDIVLTEAWTPLGTEAAPFEGTIDGKGHKITGLNITSTDTAALIAYAGENAVIKNIELVDVNITSDKYAAGVVGVVSEGTLIENVKVSGTITGASYAAGIAFDVDGATIKNCESSATVSGNRAAGIGAWVIDSTVENVKNTGDITGSIGASGICHAFSGTMKNAENSGTIIANGSEPAAGIAGVQKGVSTYEYCVNKGNVTSTADNANASAAGILGQTPGSAATLNYCINSGVITAEKSYAAGIAYSLYGNITANYCYNCGNVTGEDGAGGITPKAQYGTGDKALYCLVDATVTADTNVYPICNNVTDSYRYDGTTLVDKDGNAVTADAALLKLNGGTDTGFFKLDSNGKIIAG